MSKIPNARRKLDQIPAGNQYEGYLWPSNAEQPEVFNPGKDFTDDLTASTIPFIIEGWLYDLVKQKSYAIRYLDGKYIRIEYDLAVTDKKHIKYQAHDLEGVKQFKVVEYWAPEQDDNCAGMEVLRHAWTAFAGFVNPSNK